MLRVLRDESAGLVQSVGKLTTEPDESGDDLSICAFRLRATLPTEALAAQWAREFPGIVEMHRRATEETSNEKWRSKWSGDAELKVRLERSGVEYTAGAEVRYAALTASKAAFHVDLMLRSSGNTPEDVAALVQVLHGGEIEAAASNAQQELFGGIQVDDLPPEAGARAAVN